MHINDVLDKADIEQRLIETTGQSFDKLFKTLLLHQTSSTEIFQTVNNNGGNNNNDNDDSHETFLDRRYQNYEQ
ncbi:Protein of unknown function [Cotesia congregata]|uniref:Uncharacterized protein n=1 Tax=Cotesia congregata TaxID=51543 RepID=A0A8J2HM78_COTCN|nr:Protein of unknown function [Cotesia congregata]